LTADTDLTVLMHALLGTLQPGQTASRQATDVESRLAEVVTSPKTMS